MMKKYIVTYRYLCEDTVIIEASSKAEAIVKMWDEKEISQKVLKNYDPKAKVYKEIDGTVDKQRQD